MTTATAPLASTARAEAGSPIPPAARWLARGPTLAADRATWTGSIHIVDLPSADAAREFVEREPYNRAGLFHDRVIAAGRYGTLRSSPMSRGS
jgi:hypothetical protein